MKYFSIMMFVLLQTNANAQTVITYGKHKVKAEEVKQAYNKNRSQVEGESDINIQEYLNLYAEFKLKVQAAKDARIDTLESIKTDVEYFRKQLSENYLNDDASTQKLLDEAVDRSKKDLHVVYFFKPATDNPDKATMQNLYTQLKSGKSNFEELAQQASTSAARVNFMDVGFVTVFSLPYSHENVVYSLKPGEFSAPFTTASGTHIYGLLEERPAIGKWKVAQILISLPENPTEQVVKATKQRADEIYNKLKSGEPFEQLASRYSDDKFSFNINGELPEFTTGKYAADFEKEVLKLKKNGDYTKPFQTKMGFHIVRRISHQPATDVNHPDHIANIRTQLLTNNRMQLSRDVFNESIKTTTGFKLTNQVNKETLLRLADSVQANITADISNNFPESNKVIITYKKGKRTVGDWLQFVKHYTTNYNKYKGEKGEDLWKIYCDVSTTNMYRDNLEDYNTEFAFQMREFLEGNMLFEVMEKNVWGKAIADTIGLQTFYNANQTKYIWEPSATMVMYHVTDMKEAEIIKAKLTEGYTRENIEKEHPYILTDSGRFETNYLFDEDHFVPAENTFSPFKTQQDNTITFVHVLKLHPAGQQKTFEESRGLVINDYQHKLEEEWMAMLKKKYPLKVNKNAFKP